PAGIGLLDAEQAHDISAVGMEAQRAVGEGAGIGGEEGLPLARRRRHLTVALPRLAAFVADLAHELAAAILEDGRAEMAADGEPDPAELLRRIALDRQSPQLDHAR